MAVDEHMLVAQHSSRLVVVDGLPEGGHAIGLAHEENCAICDAYGNDVHTSSIGDCHDYATSVATLFGIIAENQMKDNMNSMISASNEGARLHIASLEAEISKLRNLAKQRHGEILVHMREARLIMNQRDHLAAAFEAHPRITQRLLNERNRQSNLSRKARIAKKANKRSSEDDDDDDVSFIDEYEDYQNSPYEIDEEAVSRGVFATLNQEDFPLTLYLESVNSRPPPRRQSSPRPLSPTPAAGPSRLHIARLPVVESSSGSSTRPASATNSSQPESSLARNAGPQRQGRYHTARTRPYGNRPTARTATTVPVRPTTLYPTGFIPEHPDLGEEQFLSDAQRNAIRLSSSDDRINAGIREYTPPMHPDSSLRVPRAIPLPLRVASAIWNAFRSSTYFGTTINNQIVWLINNRWTSIEREVTGALRAMKKAEGRNRVIQLTDEMRGYLNFDEKFQNPYRCMETIRNSIGAVPYAIRFNNEYTPDSGDISIWSAFNIFRRQRPSGSDLYDRFVWVLLTPTLFEDQPRREPLFDPVQIVLEQIEGWPQPSYVAIASFLQNKFCWTRSFVLENGRPYIETMVFYADGPSALSRLLGIYDTNQLSFDFSNDTRSLRQVDDERLAAAASAAAMDDGENDTDLPMPPPPYSGTELSDNTGAVEATVNEENDNIMSYVFGLTSPVSNFPAPPRRQRRHR